MVKALGGDCLVHLQGYELIAATSGFSQGKPTWGDDITDFFDYTAPRQGTRRTR